VVGPEGEGYDPDMSGEHQEWASEPRHPAGTDGTVTSSRQTGVVTS